MNRSQLAIALGLSFILHGVLLFILWDSKSNADTVLISVQYHEGEDGPSSHKSAAGSIAQAGTDVTESTSSTVSGESLGLRAAYPRLSRVLGESGRVEVEILKKQGALVLRTSSGFQRLDESAISAIEQALKSGALNTALEGRSSLVITFVFRLKN